MSKFGLLNGRSRLTEMCAKLLEPLVATDQLLQNIRGKVLEVAQDNRVGAAFFQAIRPDCAERAMRLPKLRHLGGSRCSE